MLGNKVATETAKGIIAVLVLIIIAFAYSMFVMKSQNDSYERNREKIEMIKEQNQFRNNYDIGEMK